MQDFYAVERYDALKDEWIPCQLKDLVKGDFFFLFNESGDFVLPEDYYHAYTAISDPYMFNNQVAVDWE